MVISICLILEEFKLIGEYMKYCHFYFRNLVLKHNQLEINVENDSDFSKKFEEFKRIPVKDFNINEKIKNNLFTKLDDNLGKMSESKLKWIIFSFIKWNHLYLEEDFIIMENMLEGFKMPTILDLKLGSETKVRNVKKSLDRINKSTSPTYGFRIMGSQVNFIYN